MPPKRRAPASSASATRPAPPRASRLAKQHNLSNAQESEIQEAFSLFSVHHPDFAEQSETGVLKKEDVRRCLIALGITPAAEDLPSILETLDPTSTGFVPYEPFLGLAAIYLNDRSSSPPSSAISSPPADLSDDDDLYGHPSAKAPPKSASKHQSTGKGKGKGKAKAAIATSEEEINAAFALFTKGTTGPITLAHLRRVAKELREEVSDDVLKDMIFEANGESGDGRNKDAWRKGVAIEDFENVMKRAGVFG